MVIAAQGLDQIDQFKNGLHTESPHQEHIVRVGKGQQNADNEEVQRQAAEKTDIHRAQNQQVQQQRYREENNIQRQQHTENRITVKIRLQRLTNIFEFHRIYPPYVLRTCVLKNPACRAACRPYLITIHKNPAFCNGKSSKKPVIFSVGPVFPPFPASGGGIPPRCPRQSHPCA